MKTVNGFWPGFALFALLAAPCPSYAVSANALPPDLAALLQHVEQRGQQESDNDHAFDQHYSYTRTKSTELRNSAGQLKSTENKTDSHDPTVVRPKQTIAATPRAVQQNNSPVTDTHSNVHGRQFKKSDFLLNEDLINRFDFTMAGNDVVNGRPAILIDFVPAKKDLPENNLKERFINKAAGRVWIDAEDYSLVKADLHLTQQVNIGWGLIGSVWKFTYGFERLRTADGFWYPADVHWHVEGREVIVNRIADYHETLGDVKKVK